VIVEPQLYGIHHVLSVSALRNAECSSGAARACHAQDVANAGGYVFVLAETVQLTARVKIDESTFPRRCRNHEAVQQ
jgi:hypothetical protein